MLLQYYVIRLDTLTFDTSSHTNLIGGKRKVKKLFTEIDKLQMKNPLPLSYKILTLLENDIVNDFVWLYKTDGIFKRIVINNENKYTIIDAEYISEFNTHYCFDALVINGEDIRDKPFVIRMQLMKKFIEKYNDTNNKYVINSYYKIISLADLFKKTIETSNEVSDKELIDGIILQENVCNTKDTKSKKIEPFYNTMYDRNRKYKLKLPQLNTVDFLLKYQNDNTYHLFLMHNRKPLRFDSPYNYNSHIFKLFEPEEKYLTYYPDRFKNEIKKLYSKIKQNPKQYDNTVIELSWTGLMINDFPLYFPLRIRTDKQYPNGYIVGIDDYGLVFASLFELYKNKQSIPNNLINSDKNTISIFHNISKSIRNKIFDSIDKLSNCDKIEKSCLNIASGRGSDMRILYEYNYVDIICIDNDKYILTWLVNNNVRDNCYYASKRVKVIEYDMNDDLNKLTTLINKRYSEKFDLILLNYAINYMISSLNDINIFIKQHSSDKTLFAFTFIDGDYIISHPNEEYTISNTLSIKITIDKDDNGNYIASLPLPKNDKLLLKKEQLVFRKDLEVFGNNYKEYQFEKNNYFKLIVLRIYRFN